jgi:hypothetical protein
MRRGYSINRIKHGIFKEEQKVREIVDPERTIELEDVIRFFSKEYPECPFDSVDRLRQLRNQIIQCALECNRKVISVKL